MYAIRSYYDLQLGHITFPPVPERGAQQCQHDSPIEVPRHSQNDTVGRITSYNVCYTKLLRDLPSSRPSKQKVARIITTASSRRKRSSDTNRSGKNDRMVPIVMDPRHLLTSFKFAVLVWGLLWQTGVIAAEPIAIQNILDAPRDYHLRQVILQGTVRSVQPLDPVITSYSIHYTKLYDPTLRHRDALSSSTEAPPPSNQPRVRRV